MKNYLSNILIYIAALCGIISFAGLFATPLMLQDTIKGTWSVYNVKAYLGQGQPDHVNQEPGEQRDLLVLLRHQLPGVRGHPPLQHQGRGEVS